MALLMVAVGGALGSILRYGLGVVLNQPIWPWGTWLANVLGSFLIGLIYVVGKEKAGLSPELFLLLATGMMGGFTTFSTFSLEVVTMLLHGDLMRALLYATVSVVIGFALAYVGILAGRQLF